MTYRVLLIGLGLSFTAVVAAVCIVAFDGSDRNASLMLLLSAALFCAPLAIAYAQQKTDHWLARFPGPVVISAPAWQRILLCLILLVFASMPLLGGAILEVRRGDWEFSKIAIVCAFGLLFFMGALWQLPRRELLLSRDGLEYRTPWRTHSHSWSSFLNFHVRGSRWSYIECELVDQPSSRWTGPRMLRIGAPLGAPKDTLAALLVAWQKRALVNTAAADAAHRAAASDPDLRQRSLLDYV